MKSFVEINTELFHGFVFFSLQILNIRQGSHYDISLIILKL